MFGDLNDTKTSLSFLFVPIAMSDCDEGTRKGGKTESKARRKRQGRGRTKGKTAATRERAGNSA